jgi:hypothetical protein
MTASPKESQGPVSPLTAHHGFDPSTVYGLLDAGAPQRFVRSLLATFPDPAAWRRGDPLPGEDRRWRSAPPKDPGTRSLVLGTEDYPWCLSTLASPPVLLLVEGDPSLLAPAVCVTGSRAMSALGRSVTDVVLDEMAALGASLVAGTESGVEEHAVRGALNRGVSTVLVLSSGRLAAGERVDALRRDVSEAGGVVVTQFPHDVRASSFTLQATTRLLAAFGSPLVVAEAGAPSAATGLAGEALRVGSPLLVPLPPRSMRREVGARGLLALADVENVDDLGWGGDLLCRRGVNGFANAVAESGDELRMMLRVLWWLRPRGAGDLIRRTPGGRDEVVAIDPRGTGATP